MEPSASLLGSTAENTGAHWPGGGKKTSARDWVSLARSMLHPARSPNHSD